MKHNVVKWSTKLIMSFNSNRYWPSGILIHQQNLYVPRSQWHTSHREAQSRKLVSKVKNLPLYYNQFLPPLLTFVVHLSQNYAGICTSPAGLV
jgi:hypothetical protein